MNDFTFNNVIFLYYLKLNAHEEKDEVDGSSSSKKVKKVADCQLDLKTQNLIKLIFDNDMFKEAMTKFEIGLFLLHKQSFLTSHFFLPRFLCVTPVNLVI